ncbi:MAG: dienelactone hydrolase family protein [Candidatus Limnocylindria bacterium]
MCVPPGARPPDLPPQLRSISGGAGGEDVVLVSSDGASFRTFVAKAGQGDAGVVIAPDARGLHRFYEELAERFASAGVHAIAFDYFGRTAGTARRPDDFAFQEHVAAARSRPDRIQDEVTASIAALRERTGATRVFVIGFCMGGRVAFNAAAEQPGLAGVVGFYGMPRPRDEQDDDAPIAKVGRMTAPVLGLFGGADRASSAEDIATFAAALGDRKLAHHVVTYPGAPHSFFDRAFAQYEKECADAWRRILGFISTGDPTAVS